MGPQWLIARLRELIDVVYREAAQVRSRGAVAFVIDVGLFNLLTTGLWPGDGPPPLDGHEKLAKITLGVAWRSCGPGSATGTGPSGTAVRPPRCVSWPPSW